MTDEVINNKTESFSFFKRLSGAKIREAAELAKKEALMRELTENIHDAYIEWKNAMANFETAEGKEMVDYYAYKIKASEIRYDYLIRKAKENQAQ
ncbi:MAG TPA: DUF2508 family protein [Clostridiaceae bacterium]|nr:DUF2508 family protein [Clostridiaceae bacterium]